MIKGRRPGWQAIRVEGVIQLPYAGTGRESRTITGPKAAAERDQRSQQSWQAGKMGAGQNETGARASFGFGRRVSETGTRKERPLEGGSRSRGVK
ncbi:MAG: hypothetical protein ACK55Z_19200, partial [bacterium]